MEDEPHETEVEAELKTLDEMRRNEAAFKAALNLLTSNQKGPDDE